MINIVEVIKYSQKLKLLYVEDNKEARESTLMILEELFENITIAVNGQDGYEKFKANYITKESKAFDLIITDINMPILNGLDMIAKIRETNKDISILVLSAYNQSGFFMESIKLGVEGYLLKPIDMDQFMGVLDKITHKLKLKDKADENLHFLKEYEEVTNKSSIVSKTDPKGIITFVNKEFCQISGYAKDELIGQQHNIVRHPDMNKEAFENMWNTIKNKKQVWKGIVRNLSKSGKSYYVDTTVKPILDMNDNIIEYIALRNDITNIMNPKKQLQDLIKSSKIPLAVMIKIENFEDIERFYGLNIVEEIENKFSKILENMIPKGCEFEKVFSLGYGEYVFAKDKTKCKIGIENVIINLKQFQSDINLTKIDIGDVDYDISVLVSLAYGDNVLENIKSGAKKLKETKEDFIFANDLAKDEQKKAKQNIDMLKKIKKAISDFKIVSYFQPIINNKTQQIDKYESLVRLIDEDEKVLSPFFFLDISKKGKYYSQITNIVLENSFSMLKKLDTDISINLSALDIELKSTRDKIFDLLEENKQYNSKVVFELLEDENVKDFNIIKTFIYDVKKFGVKIAIDDFGAGYSNFERLLDYQPDILKIDGCLIRDIETNSYSLSVVKTIVAFAKEQNIQTVAEFVENEAIFNILKDLGVTYSQGYYFGKPEPLQA